MTLHISANPEGPSPITTVEFFLNNVSIGSSSQAPWSITYLASQLASGSQTIKAVATNSLGLTAVAQISVSGSSGNTTPPDKISDLSGTAIAGKHTIQFAWTNPSNADLAKVNIYISTKSDPTANNGAQPISVSAIANSQGSYSLNTDGNVGTTYYSMVRPVNASGIENKDPTSDISVRALP